MAKEGQGWPHFFMLQAYPPKAPRQKDEDFEERSEQRYFAYAAVVSFILLSRYLWQNTQRASASDEGSPEDGGVRDDSAVGKTKSQVAGLSIGWRYSRARLICCLSLLSLSTMDLHDDIRLLGLTHFFRSCLSETICYFYVTVLAAVPFKDDASQKRTFLLHIDSILALIFFLYTYQDIWPLATYTQYPHGSFNLLLFIKIALLFLGGVFLPLITPYLNRFSSNKGEIQGLSMWSRMTYSYLDPLVYRVKSDSLQDLIPPIALEDRSDHLASRVPSILNRGALGKRHLFWHLFKGFRKEFLELSLLQVLHSALLLIGPIGINRLLRYLEGKGEPSTFRPWFWICALFLGPSLRSLMFQMYNNVSNQVMVQFEALLTRILYGYTLQSRLQSGPSRAKTGGLADQIGKINNLATSDIANIAAGIDVFILAIYSPILIVLSIWFLYSILEWSAIFGFGAMVLTLPLPAYFTTIMRELQNERSKKTDARVQKILEVTSMLRTIKLIGWGTRAKRQIDQLRQEELGLLKEYKGAELWTANMNFLIPLITMLVTYSTYTIVFHGELTSSRVFASMAVFEALRQHIRFVLNTIPTIVQARVSFDRFDNFIRCSDLLNNNDDVDITSHSLSVVGFRDSHFTWSPADPSAFRLKIDGEVIFKPGLTLITGPTASGKSSLLMALLGEMHLVSPANSSWVGLPHRYGVAYAAQDSWIQSGTIKENILFYAHFDEARYQEVILQCGLHRDLALFPDGDLTQIGERGLTLSGGQKARITIARAVYSNAKILLFDDTLAALDVHTANWISRQCFLGSLMRDRIVVLVTHNIGLFEAMATAILTLSPDGTYRYQLCSRDATGLTCSPRLKPDAKTVEAQELETIQETIPQTTNAEEMHQDHVTWEAFRLYVGNMSRHPTFICIAVVFLLSGNEGSLTLQAWWMGFWAAQYQKHTPLDISASFYLWVLVCMIALSISLYTINCMLINSGSLRASKIIHSLLFESILGSCWRWLDTTPTARITVRATQDMRIIDGPLPFNIRRVVELTISMLIKLGAILIFSPLYAIPAALITYLGLLNGQLYMRAQLPVRRIMSNTKSPIVAHLSATLDGLASIRAYGVQKEYTRECARRIDAYTQVAVTYWAMNRWVGVRSDVLGALFTAGLSTYLVYGSGHSSASNTGFSLTIAVGFSSMILTWVRMANSLELNANSLERIYDYTIIEQERRSSEIRPPAHWPSQGELRVANLSAKYSKDGSKVLKNINFEVRGGERIGIVGRTGAGKSSLVLALLQCIITEGEVYYDGIAASKLDVATLRSKFSVIPQIPDLFTGTLRDNLDPFHDFDDAELYAALRSVGLKLLQGDGLHNNILDTQVIGRGDNFSVGQRQIIALARALVQGHKILILDEATSAIDYQTDTALQRALRHQLHGVTILTVAHRLRTVMDFDRVMVLNEGRIAEFDQPMVLLEKTDGLLRSMVNNSADKDELYALAKGCAEREVEAEVSE